MLTKEECTKALEKLRNNGGKIACITIRCANVFEKLISEHFDNPPLKFEELERGMWVWDSRRKCLLKITRVEIDKWDRHFVHHYYDINMNGTTRTLFEENRFYRKQVLD